MKQEHNDYQRKDDGFLKQTVFQGIDRFADQTAPVVAGNDFDSGRQRSLNLGQLLLDTVDDVERIEPIPHDHNAAYCLAFSIPLGYAFANVGAERNRAEVFDEYGRS